MKAHEETDIYSVDSWNADHRWVRRGTYAHAHEGASYNNPHRGASRGYPGQGLVRIAACHADVRFVRIAGWPAEPGLQVFVDQGYKLELRTDASGTAGYCIFPDGSECEEWAFYRGECAPGTPAP
jgi:hypothetical protein